jgi:8-oxo-dGTP pyrophosphatase MutT (NUDIX family)
MAGMPEAWTIERLESRLRKGLAGTLPGTAAQLRLAPRPRIGWEPGHIPDDTRPGAALLLVYPLDGRPHVLLTVRNGELPNHAGQVSLPGGAAEGGESLEEAALREAHEEVGVRAEDVRLLGRLTALHVPVSGFALHAFVGVADRRLDLEPDTREVERVLEVPLDALSDPARYRVETRRFRSVSYEVPFIEIDGEKLWGATAMIVAEFLAVLGRAPGLDEGPPVPG